MSSTRFLIALAVAPLLLFAADPSSVQADGAAVSPLVDRLVVGTDKKGKVLVLDPVTGERIGKLKGGKFKKTGLSIAGGCFGNKSFIAVGRRVQFGSRFEFKKPKKKKKKPKKTTVSFFDADTNKRLKKKPHKKFFPFGKDWRGGVNLATGDLTGNGVDELVCGVGSGGIFQVNVFDSLTLEQLGFFEPYPREEDSTRGVFVNVGDFDGDGIDELATYRNEGDVSEVRFWGFVAGAVDGGGFPTGTFTETAAFDVFPLDYFGGMHVAVGDVTGDGCDNLVVAPAGPGENRIRAFDLDGLPVIDDIVVPGPFDGVGVTTGDVTGDGREEIHWWVFAAATTNVDSTITVTDTQTGFLKEYENPLGTPFQPIQDTQAFATCP